MSSSTEGQEVEIHVGLTSTDSSMTTTEKQASITASMEAQVKFMFGETKMSVSGTVAASIQNEVSSSATSEYDKTTTYECNPPKYGKDKEYGASFYQWEVSNGTVTSYDNVYICRTGVNWNTAPSCPPSACVDGNCDSCKSWQA